MAGQSQILPSMAIGTSQYKWRPFHTALSTFGGSLSGAGAYLGPIDLPSTSTDFSANPQIVSPPLDPTNGALIKAALTNAAGATAQLSIFGLAEIEGTHAPTKRGDVLQVEGDLLWQGTLVAGTTPVPAGSLLVLPPTGKTLFWVDTISAVAVDQTRNGVTLLTKTAGGALQILFDRLGYGRLLWEWKLGTAEACYGQYRLI